MRLFGLTGGIATGKSTVATMLAGHGAAIVDADALAREVVLPGTPGFQSVVDRFGGDVVGPGGDLDRARLGALVFGDPALRADLEAITHPRIAELMATRIAEALAGGAPAVFADVPLLFERPRAGMFEGVLLAYAPADVQLERLMARDGLSEDEARRRLAAQLPIDVKRERATWVVDNSRGLDDTTVQVDHWWREVIEGPAAPPSRR
jgi:dephospho-CoA kinase